MKRFTTVMIAALILCCLCVMCFPTGTYAAAKTKYTYTCIKSGDTVYCSNAHRVFKVNLNNERVKVLATARHGYPGRLTLKEKYLYYCDQSQSICSWLYQINLNTNKKETLEKSMYPAYAINGKKICYKHVNARTAKAKKYTMKLNGKAKKVKNWTIKIKNEATNAKGYFVWDDVDWNDPYVLETEANYYLATPDGSILLETLAQPILPYRGIARSCG